AAAAFHSLDRLVRLGRRWTCTSDRSRRYKSLRELIIAEAARVQGVRQGKGSRTLRFASDVGDLSLDARFERTGQGDIVAVLLQDVTATVRAELELSRTREALMQKERVRLLGVLAAGVAHDLGTTLRAASLFTEGLLRDPTLQSRQQDIRQLAQVIEAASDTVGKLHTFAKAGSAPLGAVDLKEQLRDAVAVVGLHAEGRTDIKFEVEVAELPLVRGSAADISHLFVNLLMNALDAMPDGGTVRVAARAR